MEYRKILVALLAAALSGQLSLFGQSVERERPAEWAGLVPGGRFMDRFLPMEGSVLSSDTWGTAEVRPRYVDNGIEDRIWSYWGGNIIKGDDGRYHAFIAAWLEASAKGHSEWPDSYVVHAVGDTPHGPFRPVDIVGKGHNPELFRAADGRYVIYVIDGRYVSDSLDGEWEYGKFDFDPRDRRIIEGLSNLSFARREDGSYVMVCRGGGIWVSRDGLSEYRQISDRRVYPAVDGRFEDPVIWKDHVQYHMIVNDWLGRIAYYLRSKDGVKWVVDPGEAYMPGIARHSDGVEEGWFKYERIKVLQDSLGRAVQANFAVIDTLKKEDRSLDNHSSKNICIPLDPGVIMTVLNDRPIDAGTSVIKVRIHAEDGFDPQRDVDVASLRFGASQEVNFGRGCRAMSAEPDGRDLVVSFDGRGNGIGADEFAPKMIGRRTDGSLLYGYSRLSYVDYVEPILSARAPVFEKGGRLLFGSVEVENFGQVPSGKASVSVECRAGDKWVKAASGTVPPLGPYERVSVPLSGRYEFAEEEMCEFRISICSGKTVLSTFNVRKKPYL